jgi:hypothetical protein
VFFFSACRTDGLLCAQCACICTGAVKESDTQRIAAKGRQQGKKNPNSLRRENQSNTPTHSPKSLMQCYRSPKEACHCDLSSPGTATQSAQPCQTAGTSRRARECCSQCLRAPLGARHPASLRTNMSRNAIGTQFHP